MIDNKLFVSVLKTDFCVKYRYAIKAVQMFDSLK